MTLFAIYTVHIILPLVVIFSKLKSRINAMKKDVFLILSVYIFKNL